MRVTNCLNKLYSWLVHDFFLRNIFQQLLYYEFACVYDLCHFSRSFGPHCLLFCRWQKVFFYSTHSSSPSNCSRDFRERFVFDKKAKTERFHSFRVHFSKMKNECEVVELERERYPSNGILWIVFDINPIGFH